LLQEIVCDHVLDDDFPVRARVAESQPRTAVDFLGAEFVLRDLVAPVAESAFGELHDVALVDKCHRVSVLVDRIVEGLADQTL